jgi:hypothetical protein
VKAEVGYWVVPAKTPAGVVVARGLLGDEHLDMLGARAAGVAGIGALHELNALAFAQLSESDPLDRAAVKEEILAGTIRGDKTETLVVADGLDCALRHGKILSVASQR